MSLATNASDGKVAYASEYATDKIVGIFPGSYNIATQTTIIGGFLYRYSIPHTFGRPVFAELVASYNGGNNEDGGAGFANVYSDSSNIYIITSASTGTVAYQVIATWIDNYDTSNPVITPSISVTNNKFFDSRNNYQKVYLQNVISAPGTSGTASVNHNLGYTPNCKVFIEALPGQVWPMIAGGLADPWLYDFAAQYECEARISTTNVTMNYTGGVSAASTVRIWYRIYFDH